MKTNVDAALDLSANQPMGKMKPTVAKKAAEIWELGQFVYNCTNPDAAEGVQLANVCAISGTKREPARKSTVTLSCTMDAGATLPIGATAHVLGQPTNIWVSVEAVTNP